MVERVAGIDHARIQALSLLERFGVESIEHVHVEGFARRLEIELRQTDIEGAEAQLIVGPDGATIVLPRERNWPQQRWSIAHELGHFVLRHPPLPTKDICCPRSRRRRSDRRHWEDEANSFASALLIPDAIVAKHCDTWPMTLWAPTQLAMQCDVPWGRAAQRLMEVTWRTCAVVISIEGVIRVIWPSLAFLALCAGRMWPAERVRGGSLAGQFFETGKPCGAPAFVPASAWIADVGPERRLIEHSETRPDENAVITMLWDATESNAPRPAEATFRAMALCREYVMGELEANPLLKFNHALAPLVVLLSEHASA